MCCDEVRESKRPDCNLLVLKRQLFFPEPQVDLRNKNKSHVFRFANFDKQMKIKSKIYYRPIRHTERNSPWLTRITSLLLKISIVSALMLLTSQPIIRGA